MKPKRKASSSPDKNTPKKSHYSNLLMLNQKNGLGAYISHPEKYDLSRIIYHNEHFVAINDLYPKSSVHTLLLPRSQKHMLLHPFEAFEDAEFLAMVKEETKKLKTIVAHELRRKYGSFSKQDEAREAVLNGDIELADGESMPVGRDWEKDVLVGIHAHPSMNHLHIHVLSVDRVSESLKTRKHYNSFATPFLVDVEDFPLGEQDVRRHPGKEGYLGKELVCWRCREAFGNKFARFKEHLKEEIEEWKKE